MAAGASLFVPHQKGRSVSHWGVHSEAVGGKREGSSSKAKMCHIHVYTHCPLNFPTIRNKHVNLELSYLKMMFLKILFLSHLFLIYIFKWEPCFKYFYVCMQICIKSMTLLWKNHSIRVKRILLPTCIVLMLGFRKLQLSLTEWAYKETS